MNEYFNKTVSFKTAKQYTSIINHIAKEIGLDENPDETFIIMKFDDIKKYFETLTLPTVQNALLKLVQFLHLKPTTEACSILISQTRNKRRICS